MLGAEMSCLTNRERAGSRANVSKAAKREIPVPARRPASRCFKDLSSPASSFVTFQRPHVKNDTSDNETRKSERNVTGPAVFTVS